MVEIEKKFRVTEEQWKLVENALAEFGAAGGSVDHEVNTIYSGPSLAANGGVIRIRETGDRTLLTYKRRLPHSSDTKHQIEHETEVSNADTMREIIANLDLVPRIIYEKRRTTWKFRNVEVMLDELPFGLYMEIEGSITAIKEAEMLLGIEEFETEHETYPTLTLQKGVDNNGVAEARFDSIGK